MNWKDKINETFDKLASWLGLPPRLVPIPIRKDSQDQKNKR